MRIKRIWHYITYKGRYDIKLEQTKTIRKHPTDLIDDYFSPLHYG